MTFSLEWKPEFLKWHIRMYLTFTLASDISLIVTHIKIEGMFFKMLLCQHSNDYLILRSKITYCNDLFLCIFWTFCQSSSQQWHSPRLRIWRLYCPAENMDRIWLTTYCHRGTKCVFWTFSSFFVTNTSSHNTSILN